MESTSATLLERVRHRDDEAAWRRFVLLYTPLFYSWCAEIGLQGADAADLVQEVFTLLVQKLPEFDYDPNKKFRAWLHTVLRNKWREKHRRRSPLLLGAEAEELPEKSEVFGEVEYRRHLVGRALELIRNDFQEATWTAWQEFVVKGRPAAAVALELNVSVHSVYLAKSRVLRRLRQELNGLLD